MIVFFIPVMWISNRSNYDGKRADNLRTDFVRNFRDRLAQGGNRIMKWFSMTRQEKINLLEFCVIAFLIFLFALGLMIVLIAKGIL